MRKPLLWLISFCFISLSACGLLSTRKTAESAPEITTEYPDPSSDSPSKNSSTASEEAQTTSPESSTSSIDPSTLSNTLMAWWFMKNENHLAPSAQEEIDLTPYDAWYVKKDLKEGEKPVFVRKKSEPA